MVTKYRTILLILALVLVAGGIYYLQSQKLKRDNQAGVNVKPRPAQMQAETKSKLYPLAKEITTPDGFINADSVKLADYIGRKVILLEFWTYSCINCQRTTPYLNAWYEKYEDQGLVIIGVHTPEFEFEKDYKNVQAAVNKFGIKYPVVLDNDYSTWTAYQNHYWPRKYLIDIDGYVVYDHIGEGSYDKTEDKIQELLKERKLVLGVAAKIGEDMVKPVLPTEGPTNLPRSQEVYFGAARNTHLGNGQQNRVGQQTIVVPTKFESNSLYLTGNWDIQNEYAVNMSRQAKIIFRYQAANVYFVAGAEKGATISIFKDGQSLGQKQITDYNLYPLIQNSYGEHTLEIIIDQPGLKAFTFTFG